MRYRLLGSTGFALAWSLPTSVGRRGINPVTAALSWCLCHPAITSVIADVRTAEQLLPALAAGDGALTDNLYRELTALVPPPPVATDREEDR